jgi:hypothetical protein
MFKVTFSVTRPNTSILWENPEREEDVYVVLTEAAKRNITAVQLFSSDNLTSKIIWSAPSEEVWEEFSLKYIRKDGKVDDTWINANGMTYEITKEYIDEQVGN